MRIVYGIRFSSITTFRFSEPIIFGKASPRLTARRLQHSLVRVRLWRGKKILVYETMIYAHEFDRDNFTLVEEARANASK